MKVRFAPSPTGVLHIGGARTALYNWLAARGSGGSMVLRIEDTDRERSTDENIAQIIDALEWLELDWDEGPYSQYERRDSHAAALERMLAAGRAYHDSATAEDVRAWKAGNGARGYRGAADPSGEGAVRLRVPDGGETVVEDLIRGSVRFPNDAQDDFVIARADGTPLYNLAVAVDDAEMQITHVIRGDDHLSNTPKQLLVFEALGVAPPAFAHLPLLHGPDGKKLSKRHGAASVQELREAGYLPAAVRNYLALLGWGTDDDTTILTTPELIERFDVARVGTAAAIFDERKLRWLNGRFMRELAADAYRVAVSDQLAREGRLDAVAAEPERFAAACAIVQDKAQTLAEVWPLIAFLFGEIADDEKARAKFLGPEAAEPLGQALAILKTVEPYDAEAIERALTGLVEATGVKPKTIYQAIRVAITGTTISPGIFESLAALGRDESVGRIAAALERR